MASDEFVYQIKIPKERVAVLIGKKGITKRHIEQATSIQIEVDSKEGDVTISGDDAITLYTTQDIIKAIGRGFNPEVALLLLKQDYGFEMLNIHDFGKTKNDLIRLKGRVIGEKGKSRGIIEKLTDCYMCVYGKTVGLIGRIEDLPNARRATEMLLQGSPHANVYRWLEKQRARVKRDDSKEEW